MKKPPPKDRQPSSVTSTAIEDYAKAIYSLQNRGQGPVHTNALAERLCVTPGSVSAMLKKLAELELVEHEPYRGVRLTGSGEKIALEVIRHHRLLELYLQEALGVPWDRVHDEAEILEHVLSKELAEAIAQKLGNPTRDPHGDPIPSRDLQITEQQTQSMCSLGPGTVGVFVRVSDSDPTMLRYLAKRNICPGVTLTVTAVEPFGGPLTVTFNNAEHQIPRQLASAMRVEVA